MNKEQKLIVIQGIPSSGKSYRARKLYKLYSKSIIVSRDDIRSMFGDYWVPAREKLVTKIEIDMIMEGLKDGYNVIVDAVNLNPRTLKYFIKISQELNVHLVYEKLNTSPIKAYLLVLWKTLLGGNYISYKVIKNFYTRYYEKNSK